MDDDKTADMKDFILPSRKWTNTSDTAANWYGYHQEEEHEKNANVPIVIPDILKEERKIAGRCQECGTLLPISIHGLQPCRVCK